MFFSREFFFRKKEYSGTFVFGVCSNLSFINILEKLAFVHFFLRCSIVESGKKTHGNEISTLYNRVHVGFIKW